MMTLPGRMAPMQLDGEQWVKLSDVTDFADVLTKERDDAQAELQQLSALLAPCTRTGETIIETVRRVLISKAQMSERIIAWSGDPDFYTGSRCADELQCLLNLL